MPDTIIVNSPIGSSITFVSSPLTNDCRRQIRERVAALVFEEAEAALAVYPGSYPMCAKCGCEYIENSQYHPSTDECPEHLTWTCKCGYIFATKTRSK
jgi:hypothetical protein